jgi:hypothetical protein
VTKSLFRISGLALFESTLLLPVIAVFIAMVLSFFLTRKPKLEFCRYFDVKMLGTGRDMMGLHEQNEILAISTMVLF